MKLPEFDTRMVPTVRSDWKRLYEYRRGPFWWYVGCTVRMKRIRHKDAEKIIEVCRAVDLAFPQYKQKRRRPNDGSGLNVHGIERVL